ncbi:DUF1344 domain-containing protein [Aurantimonas sp. 22II-16-19i]|uniref:DUF1344 domain-containing protein n=1 Tax=Aurantimonas sp. 22II-16-19i TaxID=1317114 RepID=UPI0009F7FE3F|nr:DUF1344 domain-containing protein [Aurantimonas sp. 22II-16-19i]ORE92791.1 hypothetical protein ATO4_16400 [Aurantimonas sp. 22II-16-19i]
MRSLTIPLTLAACLIAGAPAFAASPSMAQDAMSHGTTPSGSMSSGAMSGGAMSKGSVKHVASAKAHEATGRIKSVDAAARTLTLADGKTFVLPADVTASAVKTGEHVRVSYLMNGKTRSATSVRAMK